MIIPTELLNFYDNIYIELSRLQEKVEPILKDISRNNSGFHICDIKKPESLVQKIDISDDVKVNDVIDLFRATIIVPTKKEIEMVKSDLEEFFVVKEKIENREKRPELFIYDDLHLFLVFQDDQILENEDYKKRPFELQIKSFLQYGWQKATHDLIYKGQELNWSNHRIAYQIKAMLEQSDELLADIDRSSDICPKNDYPHFKNLNKIISLVKEKFNISALPDDLRGMAVNINELLYITKLDITYLTNEINSEDNRELINNLSLSPFQSILAIVIKKKPVNLVNGLKKHNRNIFVCRSMKDFLGRIPDELDDYIIKLT